jgi:hypothetical protein
VRQKSTILLWALPPYKLPVQKALILSGTAAHRPWHATLLMPCSISPKGWVSVTLPTATPESHARLTCTTLVSSRTRMVRSLQPISGHHESAHERGAIVATVMLSGDMKQQRSVDSSNVVTAA